MTRFTIYRSAIRSYYPEEGTGHRYTFGPADGHVCHHPGTDLITQAETDAEPFAVVLAPDGSHLAESRGGETCLYIQGKDLGCPADSAYFMAAEGIGGLQLVTTEESTQCPA